MRRFQPLLALLVPFLAAGCVTQRAELPNFEGPAAAKVRFVDKMPLGWIDLFPEDDCNNGASLVSKPFALIDQMIVAAGPPPKRVGMIDPPDPFDRDVAEISVPFGRIVNFGVSGGHGNNCFGGASFRTRENTQYEVRLDPGKDGCSLTVSILTEADGVPQRTPVRDVQRLICRTAP